MASIYRACIASRGKNATVSGILISYPVILRLIEVLDLPVGLLFVFLRTVAAKKFRPK